MSQSLYEAFGVISPKADTKKIPLEKACKLGTHTNVVADKNYVFEYKPLRRALKNIDCQKPMWLHGPSGCGKTELMIQIGARLNRPVHVISMGEEMSIKELMGSFELKAAENNNGFETAFSYGLLPRAMQDEGALVVLDEFNMAPPAAAAQLNRLLEVGEIAIPETGEVIKSAKDVTYIVTANTAGGIDEGGIYTGSQTQNGATRARFAGLRVNYLPPDKEEQLLTRLYPRINSIIELSETSGTVSSLMVKTANSIRTSVNNHDVSLPFTVRNLKEWASSTLQFKDTGDAFANAYYDMLSESERMTVGAIFKKHFGWSPEE